MNVQRAVQVFSPPVTAAMKLLQEQAGHTCDASFAGVGPTVQFMDTVHRWFVLMDVSNCTQHLHQKNADCKQFESAGDERLIWLETSFLDYLADLKTTMADVLTLTPLNMPSIDVVRVEGEDIQPEEFDQGHWFEIKKNNRRLTVDVDRPRSDKTPLQRANETSWKKKKGNRQIRQLIVASRMPHLPVDDYRIIIRPRGRLHLTEHGKDRIYHSVRRAANVERTADEEDNLYLNQKQNIIVLSTPSKERAKTYVAITSLSIVCKEYEACAYRAAPENTSKGVIQGVSADESPDNIARKLVTPRNPSVLYAKPIRNTDNINRHF
ncbi:hypothetical protein HPB49_025555 [Dermacentor silvarum]|uniref:Uncharacterized protein n=1 Tax=Dermacentor silvarum TaxID=543639 RepID=A0ACB8E4P4_DERSI|nr:hypothetical protein HPB49_025555 [Dermacentor silvarum]